jgi:hypothetical protein
MPRDPASSAWWEPFEVPSGQQATLSLGPLVIHLHRGLDQWTLSTEQGKEGDEPIRAGRTLDEGGLSAGQYARYVLHSPRGQLAFRPALADRPVVVRPRQPVFILPGQQITLYISTPVWIRVEAGDPPRLLQEVPVMRLSDTWFGPSTREGELCYAARTHARHALDELPLRPHRAVTPVRIHNRADSHLPIEKLSLPVPLLSLFGGADGSLWTEGVNLTRTAESELASMKIDPGPPRDAAGAHLLGGPRRHPERGGLVRAFSGLFE